MSFNVKLINPFASGADSLNVSDLNQVPNDLTFKEDQQYAAGPDLARAILSIIICIVGLFGNSLAIFVIIVLKEYTKSVTHWYVLQLAIADSLFLMTLPFSASQDLNNAWIYPEWLCKAKEAILFFNYYASILFLMVMSFDRYIAVCRTFSTSLQKLRKRTSAFIIAMSVWAIALALCIPVMLYSIKSGEEPNCTCSFNFPGEPVENVCAQELFDKKAYEICMRFHNLEVQHKRNGCRNPNIESLGLKDLNENDYYIEKIFNVADLYIPSSGFKNLSDLDYYSSSGANKNSNNFGSGNTESSLPRQKTHQPDCHYFQQSRYFIAFLVFNFTVMFIVPLLVMIVCYGLIINRLSATKIRSSTPTSVSFTQSTYKNSKSSQRKKTPSRSDKDRKRVTLMCAALVTSFIMCWLPFHAVHLARISGIQSTSTLVCRALGVVGSVFAFLNSALNPYLYSFLGTNFSRRWRLLKKSRGFRNFVRAAAWKHSDSSGSNRVSKARNGKANCNPKRSQGSSSKGVVPPATQKTKVSISKYHQSQAQLPSQSETPSLEDAYYHQIHLVEQCDTKRDAVEVENRQSTAKQV